MATMSELNVVIRRPGAGDVAGAAATQNRGWREAYGHLLPETFYDDVAFERRSRKWQGLVDAQDPKDRLWVAERESGIIGIAWARYIDVEDRARDLELRALYVVSSHSGVGIGQRLLDAAIGHEPAQLWVTRENTRAQEFYRRNDFEADGVAEELKDVGGIVDLRFVR